MPSDAPAGAEVRTSAGERFPLVDSMRAVAALSVLAYHVSLGRPIPFASTLRPYTEHLFFGVTIFFLISGFLLYRPFLAARIEGRDASERAYAIRRLARIVPAYWVALVLVALFGHAGESVRDHPLSYFGFAQIYDAETISGGIGQAWTLCVEMTFYVLLPIYALLLARGRVGVQRGWRGEVAALGVLVAIGVAWLIAYTPQGSATGFRVPETIWLPRFLIQFAAGMGLAVLSVYLSQGGRLRGPVRALHDHPTVAWLPAPFLYAAAVNLDPGPLRDIADALAAACLLWPAVFAVSGRGVAGRLLAWRPLVFAGTVSYGIYLYHFAIITRLDDRLDSVGGTTGTFFLLAAATATAIFVGWMSWRLIERPAMQWARRRVGSLARRPSASPP